MLTIAALNSMSPEGMVSMINVLKLRAIPIDKADIKIVCLRRFIVTILEIDSARIFEVVILS